MVRDASAQQQQVREALLRDAEEPLPELLAACEASRTALLEVLSGVTEAQARFKPRPLGPGEEDAWCIAEVLRHLIQAEEGIADRVRKLALGQAAAGSVPGALGGHEATPLAGLVEALSTSRERLRAVVAELAGRERLRTTATHAFYGELNFRAWMALWARHERGHARQVEQVKATEGYPWS